MALIVALIVALYRYATPAGVLIAPRYRSDFEIVQSQVDPVDPLEAAEPESGLLITCMC